jgi:hypothetical protein
MLRLRLGEERILFWTNGEREMFLTFGLVIDAVLVVLGILWCREMFGRWPKDVAEYRSTKDASTRQVLMILWGITALIVLMLINFFVGILRGIGVL